MINVAILIELLIVTERQTDAWTQAHSRYRANIRHVGKNLSLTNTAASLS